jgi:hypothetical protein
MLSDRSIAPEEVLLLRPTREDTSVTLAADSREIRALLEDGLSMGEAVLPRVAPAHPGGLESRHGALGASTACAAS